MRLLKYTAGVCLLLVLFGAIVGAMELRHPVPVHQPEVVSSVEPVKTRYPVSNRDLESEVNLVRVQNGLDKLGSNGSLQASAQARADFLCGNNEWSHDDFYGSIRYDFYKVGENLEYSGVHRDTRTIVQAWVNSPTHYANMIDPVFTEQGMGIRYCNNYQGLSEAIIVVNHFGKLK